MQRQQHLRELEWVSVPFSKHFVGFHALHHLQIDKLRMSHREACSGFRPAKNSTAQSASCLVPRLRLQVLGPHVPGDQGDATAGSVAGGRPSLAIVP